MRSLAELRSMAIQLFGSVIAGLDPAIHRNQGIFLKMVDARVKPGHDSVAVIPGRAKREPGIHNHDREYGFRARAKWRAPE